MQISARELAHILKGEIEGNPDVIVNRPSKIEEGGEGTITFLANLRYEQYAYNTSASILLVEEGFKPSQSIPATIIRVEDVYNAVAFLLEKFNQNSIGPKGISSHVLIAESTIIAATASIGHYSVIEENVSIGEGSSIHAQVYVGKGAEIGKNTIIHPGVKIYHDCVIGDNCIIHSNAVIGSDGFGFAPLEDGTYRKITQIGNVVIEDNVEIGANTTIDRATMGSTIIRKGVKLDNLIMVAHNVEIGENTVIAAQTGIAGSTKIGDRCRIGGQAGFGGHLKIAEGTQVQAQTGIIQSIKTPDTAISGSPAIPYKDFFRAATVFKKLPELYRRFNRLEKLLSKEKNQKKSLE
ncbi:MAG: UDP-3-O-(3-hydroxymyristoyl)glucosamine N-acyltransferase [Bacteroidetes bacterium]|nr:UDP-3-O-(3-hydroxymyristoyl)glucosamine N-acyltransferase [Bacteroidota bacterium]